MSRSSRQTEKYGNGNELSGASNYEGSAARTRPFSLEEIMIRRKNKKVTTDAKVGAGDAGKLSKQNTVENFSDHPEHDGDYGHGKESTHYNAKKATENTMKRSSRKEEATSLKERSSVKVGDKEHRDSEISLKVKLDSETGRGKERKNEKHNHHRSRNEEHPRGDNETDMTKERKNEKQNHHRSRNEAHLRDDNETDIAKERKNENQNHHRNRNEEHRRRDDNETDRAKEHKNEKQSQHRSRNEKRLRDENETRKKYAEKLVPKDTFLDSEREKSERESKRKHRSREERKDRLEKVESAAKNHDSSKYHPELAERKDRKRDTSKSHYDGSGQKRRRSRSAEFRARDRSISLSPRAHKRTYDGQEHGETSLQSSKDRRQHSDADRNRVPSNGVQTSNHNWRQGGRGNRLGGYSPRKRRSEAAIKTPSPTIRSPERKNAGWDLPPTGTGSMPGGIIPDFQSLHQIVSTEHKLSSAVPLTPNAVGSLSGASTSSVSKAKDVTNDPIQLSEATRPLRRLYVENLPASASDKSIVECLNNFLLSSGANRIQGTQPCISCNISKDKGQALVEFLTAEDATTALSFDGRSFSSSVLKIRRPKEFVDEVTGDLEKSVDAVDAISDVVKDSPHKIFVGGISKALSSDMIMEIVSDFGHLKAYRFEVNGDLKEPSVFLEYIDQTITLKACAGLNGMKLGGQVLTVVQAVPDASVEENTEKLPFYGIPEHAKPVLSKPTKVLKLKNVINSEDLSSISGSELEETLEDIRIECARFGTVKSVNVVRCESSCAIADQTNEGTLQDPGGDSFTERTETMNQDIEHNSGDNSIAEASVDLKEPLDDGGNFKDDRPGDDKPEEDYDKKEMSEMCQLDSSLATDVPTNNLNATTNPLEAPSLLDTSKIKFTNGADSVQNDSNMDNSRMVGEELKQEEVNGGLQEASSQLNHTGGESETIQRDERKRKISEDEVFERGCVLVEYVRTEASCIAAHCLHGRIYGDRTVQVSYVPHELYLSRFPK